MQLRFLVVSSLTDSATETNRFITVMLGGGGLFSVTGQNLIHSSQAKFRECTSFVPVNVVLMCKLLLPSKSVKTSWIRRNPTDCRRLLLPSGAALHVKIYGGYSTPFVGFLALTSCEVSWVGRTFTPWTGEIALLLGNKIHQRYFTRNQQKYNLSQ